MGSDGQQRYSLPFEWWMLEQHRDQIRLAPSQRLEIVDPLDTAWELVLASNADVDTLLRADDAVRESFRPPIYGEGGRRQADPEFEAHLWQRLGPLAVQRWNWPPRRPLATGTRRGCAQAGPI